MSCGREEDRQWNCAKARGVNSQKVSSVGRDIGDPCLSQSPIKVVIAVRLSNYNLSFYFPPSVLYSLGYATTKIKVTWIFMS